MPIDWQLLTRGARLKTNGEEIVVSLPDERQQRVFVDERASDGRSLRIWSVVAKPSAVDAATELIEAPDGERLRPRDAVHLLAWDRNRTSDLVGFKIDPRGRLIGEAWVPAAGLDADEWGYYVRTLAWSCDRAEYLLTGGDSD